MEYYFGDDNYPKDGLLRDCEDSLGYISINEILSLDQMEDLGATLKDVRVAARYSNIFEISSCGNYIRK